jgi:hypothetical protein
MLSGAPPKNYSNSFFLLHTISPVSKRFLIKRISTDYSIPIK